jgi:hypothetical protein
MGPERKKMQSKIQTKRQQEQLSKDLLSLAGEHRVASELCKRGIFATLTPGNRKQTDVYVIEDSTKRVLRVEVKASQKTDDKKTFVTKFFQKDNSNAPDFWVLALFRPGQQERFFILTNEEIMALQEARNAK